MITKEDINRINFLARKSKKDGLTEEEKEEQKRLRKKYIDWIKYQVKSQLDSIKIVEPDAHTLNNDDHGHNSACSCHEHCNCHKN